MAQILADENVAYPVVEELRRLGHDILTVQDIGKANVRWPDESLFYYAIAQERVILTLNRLHFLRLHRKLSTHPGLIACTHDSDTVALAQRINKAITDEVDLRGKFLRVYRPSL